MFHQFESILNISSSYRSPREGKSNGDIGVCLSLAKTHYLEALLEFLVGHLLYGVWDEGNTDNVDICGHFYTSNGNTVLFVKRCVVSNRDRVVQDELCEISCLVIE